MSEQQLQPLLAATRALWPAPATVSGRRRGIGSVSRAGGAGSQVLAEYLVIPSARRPLMLLPAGHRRAALAAASRWGSGGARWRRQALAAVLRADLAGVLLRDRVVVEGPTPTDPARTDPARTDPAHTDLAAWLEDLLGVPVLLAIRTGSLRANRKPVLQVLDTDGAVRAFVKVGDNPLTRDLVRAEAAALRRVAAAGLRSVRVPEVVSAGEWNGLELLVMRPLPLRGSAAGTPAAPPSGALRELAGLGAPAESLPLVKTAWWTALLARAGELTDPGVGRRLGAVLDALNVRAGGDPLPVGAWHGDLTSWNCELDPAGDRLLVWDFERFAEGVPLGFDALHFRMNAVRIGAGVPMAAAVATVRAESATLLAPFGVPAEQAPLVAELYLAELTGRYLADGESANGGRVHRHGVALLDLIEVAGPPVP